MSVRARHGDLLAVVALACAAAVVVLLALPTPLRAALGIPLVLAAPGYALVTALFGDDRPQLAMGVVLSLALSVALCIAAALGLQLAGVPLTARSFALALAGICVVAAAAGALRRRAAASPADAGAARRGAATSPAEAGAGRRPVAGGPAEGEAGAMPGRADLRGPWLTLLRPWALPLAILAAVFGGLFAELRRPLPDRAVEGYTVLTAKRAAPATIDVGIHNQEQASQRYHVQVLAFFSDTGYRTIGRSDPVVRPGRRFDEVVRTAPAGRARSIRVRLYRASEPHRVYRSVYLQP